MRERAFSLLKLVYQPNHYPEGVRFEPLIPTSLKSELGATLPGFSPESFRSAADRLTKVLKRELKPLLASSGASYPDELEMVILSRFHKKSQPPTLTL